MKSMITSMSHVWVALVSLVFLGQCVAAEPRPLVVSHRGLLRDAPENTLANFRACLELRIGFEFDVQRTKDGQLVCIHDDSVDRTTNGKGLVTELTSSEIRELDAGSWFDSKFTGEKIPTVDEVLRLVADYRHHEFLVAVDLKAEDVEKEVVRLAAQHKVLDRLLFIGRTISEPLVRRNIKTVSMIAQTCAVANNSAELPSAVTAPDTDWVYVRFLPDKAQIEAIHRSKRRVFIAGPIVSGNLPENWRHAATVGMDAILTDFALELQQQIRLTDR